MTKLLPSNPIIEAAAYRHGLRKEWLLALLVVESALVIDPTPRWEPHIFEHSYGIGQVLPSTAMWMARSPIQFPILQDIRDRLLDAAKLIGWHGEKKINKLYQHADFGVELAAAYLGYQYRRYSQDLDKAVAAYNAGSARYKDGQFVNQGYVIKFHQALHKIKEH